MKFIFFFIYIPFVYSELHKFYTKYAEIKGQTLAGIPKIFSVTTLDGRQIDYYDSEIKKLIPRQDWMKEFMSGDRFKEYTEIREQVQQIYKNNVHVLMEQFNHSHGVHTYQRKYGCEWDDQTGDSHGFDQHGYDGEDFISLDVNEPRYIAYVLQAKSTVWRWNTDREQLAFLKQYYDLKCTYWLKEFLHLSKATFNKTEPPKVSLLKKKPDYYVGCHVTGFHFRETIILWRTNGQDIKNFSKLVESKETLPNGDGTFQRTVALKFLPDDWKKNQYACVVEHESLTEQVQANLTVDDTNISNMHPAIFVITVICSLLALCVGLYYCCRNKPKPGKKFKYLQNACASTEILSGQCLIDAQNHFPEHLAS